MQEKFTDELALRRLAEQSLTGKTAPPDSGFNRDVLMHELRVHRAELEMQNEALRDAHLELQTSEERYRELFDNAPTGYLILDETGRIELANARASEILCLPLEDLLGTRLSQYLPPEEAVAYERHRREVTRTVGHLLAEFTLITKSGRREVKFESCCTSPVMGKWRVALIDVTEPNSVARKLNHSERLDAVGRHASGVAHDLKNLLFAIAGRADIALHHLTTDHPAHAAITQLRAVVQRGADRIEQLAAFSRSEAEQAPVVDLNLTISSAADMLRGVLGSDIQLELHLVAADAAVRMDPAHIEQIFVSAARNARQAMPNGGTFTIETASIEFNDPTLAPGVASMRHVRWAMKDTGTGMDEETRKRAFEPFFTTKPSGVGTGLGLSMVSAVVERAGGDVALESAPGQGTSLVIRLPCATGYARTPPPSSAPPADAAPFSTVMVVEDNPEARSLIASRLRDAGYDVVLAANGIEALNQLRRLKDEVKLVLLDEELPGASFQELARAIRSISEGVEIVVTPLLAANDDEDALDEVSSTVLRTLGTLKYERG